MIHKKIEHQTLMNPNKVAVEFGEHSITYFQLNNRANQIANTLIEKGVGEDSLIGVLLNRSIDMIATVLGILKAGAAYVPLDPSLPKKRINFIIQDARLEAVISQYSLNELLEESEEKLVIYFEEIVKPGNYEKSENPTLLTYSNESLAYAIYTSGTTGNPKGVMVQHDSLSNLLMGMDKVIGCEPEDKMLANTNLSFDISIVELFWPLTLGATVLLLDDKEILNRPSIIGQLKPTLVQMTPSVLATLLSSTSVFENFKTVKKLIIGGEKLHFSLIKDLFQLPNIKIFNGYGPTEATIYTTLHEVKSPEIYLGDPLPHYNLHILNKDGQTVSLGEPGELFISGIGLARGYINQHELTVEKFNSNRFTISAERLYMTGDLVSKNINGDLEFIGRVDNQVKLRGFRIELGEIEEVLLEFQGVRQAAAIVKEDQLIAFITHQNHSEFDVVELHKHLKEKLPYYMLPTKINVLDNLPLNQNGKVNRTSLIGMDDLNNLDSTTEKPIDETEERVCNLFAKVLSKNQVNMEDNFFELGGNSLKAVILINAFEKEFKIAIPFDVFFRMPSPKGLCNILRGKNIEIDSLLVEMARGGDNKHIFFIHPLDGYVSPYSHLAMILGTAGHPVYGFQATGLKSLESETLESIAEKYVTELRLLNLKSPFVLIGWSLGGTIAYEMTKILEGMGLKNVDLVLLDTPPAEFNVLNRDPRLIQLIDSLEWHEIDRKVLLNMSEEQAFEFTLKEAKLNNRIPQSITLDLFKHMANIVVSLDKILFEYKPSGVISSDINIYTASESMPDEETLIDTSGWHARTKGEISLKQVSGNHLTLITYPNVLTLGERLLKLLDKDNKIEKNERIFE